MPSQAVWETDFPISRPTQLSQVDHRLGSPSLPRPAIGDSGWDVVQEYQPVVHRLRLSASAYVPTKPEQISLTQDPLGIRRTSFSLVFRYSCQHSHFPTLHGWLPPPLRRCWERSPTTPSEDEVRGFGSMLEPRYIVRARPLDQ